MFLGMIERKVFVQTHIYAKVPWQARTVNATDNCVAKRIGVTCIRLTASRPCHEVDSGILESLHTCNGRTFTLVKTVVDVGNDSMTRVIVERSYISQIR